ncbi:uncharacterized protein LOC130184535 isoform X2 [Seriola aureovittata]|uniref:uncharacterized protein LOC130184535 isoform X2 n=1 Tax=Seriola aureovittata TaxID=2871759 RepID=UPI0024BDE6B0|nr:uncharacterized protein LOC130184535 isoform X2 [Seriola aureovittata]
MEPHWCDKACHWDHWIIGIIGIIVLVLCYITWKKDMKGQHRSSTLTCFCRYLLTSCCLRKGNSEAELTETAETTLVDIPPATDLQGSGGNDPEQDDTLKTVHVHSVNPKTDGNSPYNNGLDHNLNNESTENGDIKAPDVDRAMNRDLRDDPGGSDVVTVTDMHSGCVCDDFGDCGREDHEAEGESLLPNERANIQGPDMTGGAEAFVNKCGFDPDQVSRCFAAPNTDVESTPKMKNVI